MKYLIKKMTKMHCGRGPKRCKICEEYAKEMKFALLDIAPEVHPEAARPMIEIEVEGEKVFQVYDVVAYFNSLEEAESYANQKMISYEILFQEYPWTKNRIKMVFIYNIFISIKRKREKMTLSLINLINIEWLELNTAAKKVW